MSRIVQLPLEGGQHVLIEITEPDEPGMDRIGRGERAVEAARQTFEEGLSQVRPVIQAVVQQFQGMNETPSKITLQFGLKVSGELNVVIGKAASEANFTVSVEWNAPARA